MLILGINAYHGDAAAAIVKDGILIAAVEEERFNRVKHCAGFPTESVRYCLREARVRIEDIEHIGISRDPSAHLHQKIIFAATRAAKSGGQWAVTGGPQLLNRRGNNKQQTLVGINGSGLGIQDPIVTTSSSGNGRGILGQVRDRLENAVRVRDLKGELARGLDVSNDILKAQFHNIEHHRAHLASSFYVSPFERAALLSIDGFGDFISTMCAVGEGNSIKVLDQVEYPHSLGIAYTATTQFLGFPHYGDEGKVMGLAPYGSPRYLNEFRNIIRTEDDGKFALNLDYFRHHAEGVEMTWNDGSPVIGRLYSTAFAQTFGPARQAGALLTDRERDIAASLQHRLEEVGFHILNHLHHRTGLTDLGLSGGVAYNSVMNGKILLKTPFSRVFVQPAAGDSGTALGVCFEIHNRMVAGGWRAESGAKAITQTNSLDYGVEQSVRLRSDVSDLPQETETPKDTCIEHETQTNSLGYVMTAAFTGPAFSNVEICEELQGSELWYETYTDEAVTKRAAEDIADGLVVGWFQGRMEFGPRALGNRSIVVDPRHPGMKDILNERIKKREPFRPFAPSILEESVGDYFEQSHPSPTMLMVYQIREEKRAEIPAVVHVDGSGRLQTVSRNDNPRYHQLISDFYKLSGVPIILNTSFNENEPIVCTPRHAIDCFLKTRMDVLYMGNQRVEKKVLRKNAIGLNTG